MTQIRVWDAPLRIFHWLLVLAVVSAFVSGEIGGNLMDWHGRIGLFILGLLVFRLVWGLVGSTHSRFLNFIPTPGRIRAYLKGEWHGLGHNPLGALSVFGLLGLLLIQVGTGLFANDDIAFRGPLARLVSDGLSGKLTGVHEVISKLLMLLVALHVSAIAFYLHVKKHNLVRPMITGVEEVPEAEAPKLEQPRGGGLIAFVFAAALGVAAVWFIGSGRLANCVAPPPPPAAPASTPAW